MGAVIIEEMGVKGCCKGSFKGLGVIGFRDYKGFGLGIRV